MPKSKKKKVIDNGFEDDNSKKISLSIGDECDSYKNSTYTMEDLHLLSKNTYTSDSTSKYFDTDTNINKFDDSTKRKTKNFKSSMTIFKNSETSSKILDYDQFLEILNDDVVNSKYKEEHFIQEKPIMRKNTAKTTQKIMKENKKNYQSKIKRKIYYQRKTSNLFDLNNFIIPNCSINIKSKHMTVNIPIPIYKELTDSFYDEPYDTSSPLQNKIDEEFSSDDVILSYHNLCEMKEIEYRTNFFKKKHKKRRSKE